jgi:hypothetical protein
MYRSEFVDKIQRVFLKLRVPSELRFILKRFFLGFEIGNESMSGKRLSSALGTICRNKSVFDWGSGGSTILISQVAKTVVSIETDKKYSRFMRIRVKNMQNVTILYANIGFTKAYGEPLTILRKIMSQRYLNVTDIFFKNINFNNFQPEIVIIDGRFRVWCALESIQNIKGDFLLVFDDYVSRSEYHPIGMILGDPCEIIGDTAFFKVQNHLIPTFEYSNFEKYNLDPR